MTLGSARWLQAKSLYLSIVIVSVFALFSSMHAWAAPPVERSPFKVKRNTSIFPLPEDLKANVEFWKKIYAYYSQSKVLIHDSEEMDIIYEVVDLNHLFPDLSRMSQKRIWRKIEDIKKQYRKKLLRLASKLSNGQRLTADEQALLSKFGDRATPAFLRKASRRLRGQQGLKDRFKLGLQRSGLYLDRIREIFRDYNLPDELTMLPHVESSFNYNAYSKMGAAGIWQFTRSTGRMYLKINYDVDERLDPLLATEAAAKLLKRNYKELQSWPLAITAYNHGFSGMKRAKRKHGDDIAAIVQDYRSRTFGFASRNFYAEFLAALEIASNYETYFGHVEFYRPAEFHTFKAKKYYHIDTILKTFKLSAEDFKQFNPALRSPVLKGHRRIPKRYKLRIPTRDSVDEKALWASISPKESYDDQVFTDWYKVRRGDNLSTLARRFGVSLYQLVEYNNLNSAHRIYPGQILKVPSKSSKTAARKKPVLLTEAPARDTKPAATDGRAATKATPPRAALTNDLVASFELTTGLATPESEIAPPNMRVDIAPGNGGSLILVPVEESTLPVPEETVTWIPDEPASDWIRVGPEETLGHYGEWLEVSAQRLRDLNNMGYSEELQFGQRIRLTFKKVSPEEFQRRRYEFQRSIEEDFFATFNVDSVKVHRVRRGQNIWHLTNRLYDVPLWLVMEYNPDRDLRNLHVGDEIIIPIVSAKATEATTFDE